jgi:hypothetical protein
MATANNAAVIRDTGPCILGNDGRRITVCASLSTISTTRHSRPIRTRSVKHGQARGIGGLGAKGLGIRRDVAKRVVCAIEAGIEARWGTRTTTIV